jgi:Ca2+-binding EF-hand superfamily protein
MYTEFIAAALAAQADIEEERIAEAFDILDTDGSGFISKKDLKEFLGSEASWKDIEAIMREGDKDKDGKSKQSVVMLRKNSNYRLTLECFLF